MDDKSNVELAYTNAGQTSTVATLPCLLTTLWTQNEAPPPYDFHENQGPISIHEPQEEEGVVPDPANIECPTTADEVITAVKESLKDDCCVDLNAVEDFRVEAITPEHAYSYTLETHTETRTVREKVEPNNFQGVAPNQRQPMVDKWSLHVAPPQPFLKGKTELEIPGSEFIAACTECQSIGTVRCRSCEGLGWTKCTSCNGLGQRSTGSNPPESCVWCNGAGRNSCTSCNLGLKICSSCQGHRFVRKSTVLLVKWNVKSKNYTTRRGTLMPNFLQKESNRNSYRMKVCVSSPRNPQPLSCTDPTVSEKARMLQNEDLAKVNDSTRVIGFRQSLDLIPVVKVEFKYKTEQVDSFYVFGRTNKVYFPNGYPKKRLCCCCSVS